jgi:hypothetical protein
MSVGAPAATEAGLARASAWDAERERTAGVPR